MNDKERELVAILGGGNRQALGDLFELHRERLNRMVQIQLDSRIRARLDVSDIVQDVQLEATRRVDEFLSQPEVSFLTWLRFLTQQKLAEAVRRNVHAQARDVRREKAVSFESPGDTSVALINLIVANSTSPSSVVAKDELRRIVESAISTMDLEDREVLLLRHVELLSSEEIAKSLAISISACRKRHYRALKRLKEMLSPLGLEFAFQK